MLFAPNGVFRFPGLKRVSIILLQVLDVLFNNFSAPHYAPENLTFNNVAVYLISLALRTKCVFPKNSGVSRIFVEGGRLGGGCL